MEFKYPYPNEYDNAIINLLEQNSEMTSKKLYKEWINILRGKAIKSVKHRKREHSKPTQYTPSLSTFSKILKRMVKDGYISKKKNEKSKRTLTETYYQLTDNAKVLLQLNILKRDESQLAFKRIYEEFFAMCNFFESVYQKAILQDSYDEFDEKVPLSERAVKHINFSSITDFEIFLEKLSIKKEKLEWMKVSYGGMSSIIPEILYPHDKSNRYLTRLKKRYWKENQSTKVKEVLLFVCYPIMESPDDLDFRVRKIEKWEIVKRKGFDIIPKLLSRQFTIFIPGVTVEDILPDDANMLERSQIHEGLNILGQAGLIKTKLFGNELRYIIGDNQLQDFISSIKVAFISEFRYLLIKWEWFEVPTSEEKERMGIIFGEKQFSKLSTALEIKLHGHKTRMRKCKNVDEYQELLNENSTYFERVSSDITLDLYKQTRKEPNTVKEQLQDVKNYWQYRRNMLQKHLDDIIMTYDEEGIEELKMDFELIINKYSFLKEILGKICPKAFEPANMEIQEAIRHRENSRQLGFEEFVKRMNAITPSGMEKDRRIIKHVDYIQGKGGKIQPILNLDKMSDEQVTDDDDLE